MNNEYLVKNEASVNYAKNDDEVINRAIEILQKRWTVGTEKFVSVEMAKQFFRLKLCENTRETLHVAFMNNQHYLISVEEIFTGTIDACTVHPREIVKRALEQNACAIMLAHNHPSGDCTPSNDDWRITKKIRAAADLLEIRLLDHIIASPVESVSMREINDSYF